MRRTSLFDWFFPNQKLKKTNKVSHSSGSAWIEFQWKFDVLIFARLRNTYRFFWTFCLSLYKYRHELFLFLPFVFLCCKTLFYSCQFGLATSKTFASSPIDTAWLFYSNRMKHIPADRNRSVFFLFDFSAERLIEWIIYIIIEL